MNKTNLSKRHPFIGIMIALLLISMLVAACGGAATPSPQDAAGVRQDAGATTEAGVRQDAGATTEAGDAGATTEATTEPSSAESQGASGTLRYGFSMDVDNWNPHREQRHFIMCYYQLVYDALIAEKPDGTLIPGLATEWKQSTKAITFTLRENVVFHDGTPFNAEAARANLLHAQQSDYKPVARQMNAVESIDILDDTHIQVNLSRPDPSLLSHLSRFAGMMVSPTVLDTDITQPVGTGPWTLNRDETEPTVRYVFDLFNDFWDPSVQGVEHIEILYLPEDVARANALQSGQVDGAWIAIGDVNTFEDAGYIIQSNTANQYALHILDSEGTIVPAFADERVRLALNYAIDRELFAEAVFNGYATPITQLSEPGQYGYAKDIADLSYNPEKAKQLLNEVGVENLEFQVPSFGMFDRPNQALAGFFADIGITMNVTAIAPGSLISEVSQGNWAAVLLPINDRHISAYVDNRVLVNGIYNPFDILEEDLEELATQAKQLPSDEAEPLWAEIARETAERGNIIHIVTVEDVVAISPKVKGGSVGYIIPGVLLIRGVTIEE